MLFNTYAPWKFGFSKDITSLNDFKDNNEGNKENIWGIIGVPFDSTTSYHSGARLGPITIREASFGFEKYNFGFEKELNTLFYDFGDLEVIHGNCEKTLKILEDATNELLSMNIHPIIIGGEHSISYAPVNVLSQEYGAGEITIIHFDAHMDMINEYQGEKYSHATVMRRIHDISPKKIIQIGIRSSSKEEIDFVSKTDNIESFSSKTVKNDITMVKDALIAIKGPVYLSIDLDVFDPSVMPSVGNPTANGLYPEDLEEFMKIIASKEVIGFDAVELSTNTLGDISSVLAAKIVYDFLTLIG
ncbi:agmatinase [Methanobrevibacter filiformis]|uniref:Agmatinase n=1 Tax=Methanobrevibacter filiformis TaxID=55758 RepID=A0A166F5Q7_9EURY|nr:agmatinase [Methanobrevibacter filiformis]KZX17342.1 agmatinase [Methanobrevibacter filiformis]